MNVGNQGQYDALVRRVLRELKAEYLEIDYAVVLAYMPRGKEAYEDMADTMLPEEIASVPLRCAIDRRNKWMLKHADFVVTYITHDWGGAAKFAKMAEKPREERGWLDNRGVEWLGVEFLELHFLPCYTEIRVKSLIISKGVCIHEKNDLSPKR